MRVFTWWGAVGSATAICAACGGAAFSVPPGGGDNTLDGAPESSNGEGGGTGEDAASSDVAMSMGDVTQGGDGSPPQDATDAPLDQDAAACPDVRGAYVIAVSQGAGCGTLNDTAPQCIRQIACGVMFRSVVEAGRPGINGSALMQSDGTFANASLVEGATARTGCTGTWNASTSTWTVDCGGSGTSQSCIVTLQRSGALCN